MPLNLCTIILPFYCLVLTNRRCANPPRMSTRAYGSIKRKKGSVFRMVSAFGYEAGDLVSITGSGGTID